MAYFPFLQVATRQIHIAEQVAISLTIMCSLQPFLSTVATISGLRFNSWNLDFFVRLCNYVCIRPRSLLLAQWFTAIRDQVPSVIGYLPGDIMRPSRSTTRKFYMHFTMLGFASNMISCISIIIFFYVYLAGDLDHVAGRVGLNSD
jgi:hypothetical protein